MGFHVLAGEGLREGKTGDFWGGKLVFHKTGWLAKTIKYKPAQITDIQVITEEDFRTLGKTAGWGLVGAAIAGPFGAVLGGYFGGKNQNVTAALYFEDGFKVLVNMKPRLFRKISAHHNVTEMKATFTEE